MSRAEDFLKFFKKEEARTNPDDWKKNFIVPGPKATIMVSVIAAENDGWRAEAGVSLGGKVIESPKQAFESNWVQTFEAAENKAKGMCRTFKCPWKGRKPYGDRSKIK
jgi:hypothetical protein